MKKKIKRRFSEKNYSLTGKISIEQYPIILQKDKILKGETKKHKIKDLFYPDQPKEEIKTIEDFNTFNNFKISLPDNNKTNNKNSKSKVELQFDDMRTNPKFFYHNKHLDLVDKFKRLVIGTENFNYAPKYDLVKPRLIEGGHWEYFSERKKEKIIYDDRDYYITHENVLNNPNIKCLVNMNRTTQREEFVKQKDIKLKNERKFISQFKLRKIKKNKNKTFHKILQTSRDGDSKNKIYKLFNISSKTSKDFYNKNKKTTSGDKNHKKIKSKRLNKKNHSVDFKKLISREDVERVKDPRYFKIPFITPNYSLVENKLISTIPYDIPKYNTKNPEIPVIHGYDYKLNYSPDKYITKFNNHISPKTPNFNYMFHREGNWSKNSKKNPLPLYMRDIHDRNSIERMTEKSLKQNKFKEGKISLASSSFLPKKSFNRIININLINSKNFKYNILDDYIEEKKEYLKQNTERINKKNTIEELKNSGLLNKFENFTYKALDKRKNTSNNNSMENIFKIAY